MSGWPVNPSRTHPTAACFDFIPSHVLARFMKSLLSAV
jgi:hypothetical protein